MHIDQFLETDAKLPSCLITADDFLGVVDGDSNIYFIRDGQLTTLQRFNSKAPIAYYKANCASGDGRRISLWIESKKNHYIFAYEKSRRGYSQLVALEGNPPSPATAATFDESGRIIALGNEKGEVMLYHTQSGKMIMELPKCADAITTIVFDKTSTLIAYASHMKDITLFDLNRNKQIEKITHKKPSDITAVRVLSTKPKVVFATTDGEVGIYDCVTKEEIYLDKKLHTPITELFLDENEKFVLVGDMVGKLYILGMELEERELEFLGDLESNIVDTVIKDGAVIALQANGNISKFDHEKYLTQLLDLIKNRSIKEIVKLGKNYPPIRYTTEYRELDLFFEKDLKKAYDLVASKEPQKATALLEPYLQEPRYKMQIGTFDLSISKVRAFGDVVASDRIEQAYAMVQTNELYKTLAPYKKLEANFGQRLRAALLMLTGRRTDVIAARKAVEIYSRVATKSKLLQAVFDMPMLFKTTSDIVTDGDYEKFKQFSSKFPTLKETPYNLIYEESGRELVAIFSEQFRKSQYYEAILTSEEINRVYSGFYPDIEERVNRAKIVLAFENAIEKENFQSALAYATRNNFLRTHSKFIDVVQHYNQIFLAAIDHAVVQNFEGMNNLLSPMLKIKIFQERTLFIYQLFYLIELEKMQLNDTQKIVVIRFLLESFGLSKMLLKVSQKIDAVKLLTTHQSLASKEFINRPIIPSLKELIN